MRIGEASKRSGVPVSTIRYYIRRGLIVPDGEGTQYLFDEQDCHTLERIVQFKKWGLSLETAHRLLSLERVSSGVEQDTVEDCVALLRTHQKRLEDQRVRYQHYKEEINEFIDELNRQAAVPHGSALAPTGVPLRALSLLCCPRCGGAFQISKADMDMSAIFSADLHCSCGYRAEIRNGIVYAECEEKYPFDEPDIDRELYRSAPSELVSLIQKSYNWMGTRIKELSLPSGSVVMETHLNSFFALYKKLTQIDPSNIYVVQDKFPAIIELYKGYIDRLPAKPEILYIAAADNTTFPLRKGCVDLLIDYCSTNEYGIYAGDFYLDRMRQYLRPSASVIGTYFYFDPDSRSLQKLREMYPLNGEKNYTRDYFKSGIRSHYHIVKQAEIGVSTDSGDGMTFDFHCTGDALYMRSFLLHPAERHRPEREEK